MVNSILMMIISFAVVLFGITYITSFSYGKTKEGFLVANRKLGLFESTFAIAASWTMSPALFISAQKAFQQGIVGLFWFIAPNILCLVLFSYFMYNLIDKYPEGFTISDYIKEKLSDRVQFLYWICLIGVSIGLTVLNMVAGGTVLSKLTGIPFIWTSVILLVIPFIYSYLYGLKASVVSDYFKLSLILISSLILIPLMINSTGGTDTIIRGLGGVTGKFTSLFDTNGLNIFLSFGLPVTIALMSGPFGDQTFWQKGFATKKEYIKKSFIGAAFIFGLVPLIMSIIGFIAAGIDINITNPAFITTEMISTVLPQWALVLFSFMVLSVATSVVDSKYCSISSIVGNDFVKKYFNVKNDEKSILKYSRISMIIFALIAFLIANIPGIKILYVMLINGILRASGMLPTILTIKGIKLSERGVFYGMLFSILIGTPVFGYATITNITWLILLSSILCLLIPGIMGLILKKEHN